MLLVGLLVLPFVTLTGAVPEPEPLRGTKVPAPLGGNVLVQDDRAFVIDPVQLTSVLTPEIAAFELPSGKPLWRVPMPLSVPPGSQSISGPGGEGVGVTLVPGELLFVYISARAGAPAETAAVEVSTGATRWRLAASFRGVTTRGDILLRGGLPVPGEPPQPGDLRAVDAASGQQRWSHPLPAGIEPAFHQTAGSVDSSTQIDQVVVRVPTGRVQVLDAASGQAVRGLDLPPIPPPPGANQDLGWRESPLVVEDLLIVTDSEHSVVSAYGLDPLDLRWTASWDPVREYGPFDCGMSVCFAAERDGGMRTLDPETGRVRWTDPRWAMTWPVGDYLIAVTADAARDTPLSVLDPATGRVLGGLGSWRLIALPDYRDHLLGVRYNQAGRTWIVALDPAERSTRVLAVLPAFAAADCQAQSNFLVCRRLDDSYGVWRLPE
jgi:hypothetical protein